MYCDINEHSLQTFRCLGVLRMYRLLNTTGGSNYVWTLTTVCRNEAEDHSCTLGWQLDTTVVHCFCVPPQHRPFSPANTTVCSTSQCSNLNRNYNKKVKFKGSKKARYNSMNQHTCVYNLHKIPSVWYRNRQCIKVVSKKATLKERDDVLWNITSPQRLFSAR